MRERARHGRTPVKKRERGEGGRKRRKKRKEKSAERAGNPRKLSEKGRARGWTGLGKTGTYNREREGHVYRGRGMRCSRSGKFSFDYSRDGFTTENVPPFFLSLSIFLSLLVGSSERPGGCCILNREHFHSRTYVSRTRKRG